MDGSGGTQQAMLTPSESSGFDSFGAAVALNWAFFAEILFGLIGGGGGVILRHVKMGWSNLE